MTKNEIISLVRSLMKHDETKTMFTHSEYGDSQVMIYKATKFGNGAVGVVVKDTKATVLVIEGIDQYDLWEGEE